ncbi:unnamed protein product [Trifolium pratense]|uniref:Uncharacterized protein n=1 Tax=Trifolium pratense TaxID=57577 RepID=A0ACB0L7C9_TRIPR|nr:unnamed protein product [Trifolium pratense]
MENPLIAIVVEEPYSSIPNNPRNMINNRDRRLEQLARTTLMLSLFLTIVVTLNTSSYIGKFMAEHDTIVMLSLVALVLFFQIAIFRITRYHLSNNNDDDNIDIKNGTLHILVLSSVTSSIEVSLISYIAAIITFILCCITLTWFVIVNSKEVRGLMNFIILVTWFTILFGPIYLLPWICTKFDL